MKYLFLSALAFCQLWFGSVTTTVNRSFAIDYEENQFLKDGKPFRMIGAAVHYYIVPPPYWFDRLLKSRAMGVNTVQMYIAWNMHEWIEGQYKFDGWSDICRFLEIAHSLGMLVSLRPSPYIDSEWDMGGLPWWLLKFPQMQLRSSETSYLAAVKRWYDVLLPKLKSFLYENGGPIVSVQIENEYSAYGCDKHYITFLRDLVRFHLGQNVVLYSNDFGMACDVVDSVYPTLDFGIDVDVKMMFAAQRTVAPKGPLVNTEFYPGWMDMWGEREHQRRPTNKILSTIGDMWAFNASFTVYMTAGGTLWGYSAGGEAISSANFTSVTTSYDFDAPINEVGDVTPKFLAIRSHLEKLSGLTNPYPIPPNSTKSVYGNLSLTRIGSFLDVLDVLCPHKNVVHSEFPMNVEWFNFPYGFVLYRTIARVAGSILSLPDVHDRAYLLINHQLEAVIQRPNFNKTINIGRINIGDQVDILVENQGRICFGPLLNDKKGLVGNVTLDGQTLVRWDIYPLDINKLFTYANKRYLNRLGRVSTGSFIPSFYSGTLDTPHQADTLLDTTGWEKGQAFVNGVNLGRYWSLGPTYTLYVPKIFLRPKNQFIIFELDIPGNCANGDQHCRMSLTDKPVRR